MAQKQGALTPMMTQFFRIKKEYPEYILFFRMGDFYEMFDEDARLCSNILGVVLTKRQQYDMCGIPFHAKDNYLYKLIRAQYKVAICEQTESTQSGKKIIDRQVVELLTPGTFYSEQLLQDNAHSFLMSVLEVKQQYHFALADVSTGSLLVGSSLSLEDLSSQLYKFSPREIILMEEQLPVFEPILREYYHNVISKGWFYKQPLEFAQNHFGSQSILSIGLDESTSLLTVSVVLRYVKENLFKDISHLKQIEWIESDKLMRLNDITIKNLELIEHSNKEYTLYTHLNRTKTNMGARRLRHWLLHPSIEEQVIQKRLNYVSYFFDHQDLCQNVRSKLSHISDIERILSKIPLKTAGPKDIWTLKTTLENILDVQNTLKNTEFAVLFESCESLLPLIETIGSTLLDPPPTQIGEEPSIQDSVSEELSNLRKKDQEKYQLLMETEQSEKEKTQISKLRIRYNKILGYYIEIPKGSSQKVPDYYIRKQTLSNLERFTIEKLIAFEQDILTAKEQLQLMEQKIFDTLCQHILEQTPLIKNHIIAIEQLDIFAAFAFLSYERGYIQPKISSQTNDLWIQDGRHPVVEQYVEIFSPNSVHLTTEKHLWIISGPNMAGKSTFLRQTALITLMAHIGCFVPAENATIPLTDQIFTRIGASDNLAKGESTFFVEMSESAHILNFSTARSLIIMDEVGRGTSTNDGLSVAWAMVEYLSQPNRGKTLFATHYHELCSLEESISSIENYRVAVKEIEHQIVFLHKVEPGKADKSYGIHVAALAGVPHEIIKRADNILNQLESKTNRPLVNSIPQISAIQDTPITNILNPIYEKIKKIKLDHITGVEALNLLSQIQKDLGKHANRPKNDDRILF